MVDPDTVLDDKKPSTWNEGKLVAKAECLTGVEIVRDAIDIVGTWWK